MYISELKLLIEKALILMENKLLESDEPIIKFYITEYYKVLEIINDDNKNITSKDLSKIKTFTRMYMETSSNYTQPFLEALAEVEGAIKRYFY